MSPEAKVLFINPAHPLQRICTCFNKFVQHTSFSYINIIKLLLYFSGGASAKKNPSSTPGLYIPTDILSNLLVRKSILIKDILEYHTPLHLASIQLPLSKPEPEFVNV